ncbi:hypothetical protein CUREO4125_01245 [Campylobacter ureolyticus]|uniref:hypothetical protein n=1 Tax=Campylobacter ureolyticus TaxID=827 RepID=UPI00215A1DDA|nr:hypothetical protein [Campylobacter ureolyticus]MCR8699013.1 hypothetical protein [Campylobacter ureolyticus]
MIYYGIVENLNRDVITNVSGSTKGSSGFSVKGTGFVFGGGDVKTETNVFYTFDIGDNSFRLSGYDVALRNGDMVIVNSDEGAGLKQVIVLANITRDYYVPSKIKPIFPVIKAFIYSIIPVVFIVAVLNEITGINNGVFSIIMSIILVCIYPFLKYKEYKSFNSMVSETINFQIPEDKKE